MVRVVGVPRHQWQACTGLLHPPVWKELIPAGLRRGRAPFDHSHVIVHRRLLDELVNFGATTLHVRDFIHTARGRHA